MQFERTNIRLSPKQSITYTRNKKAECRISPNSGKTNTCQKKIEEYLVKNHKKKYYKKIQKILFNYGQQKLK